MHFVVLLSIINSTSKHLNALIISLGLTKNIAAWKMQSVTLWTHMKNEWLLKDESSFFCIMDRKNKPSHTESGLMT